MEHPQGLCPPPSVHDENQWIYLFFVKWKQHFRFTKVWFSFLKAQLINIPRISTFVKQWQTHTSMTWLTVYLTVWNSDGLSCMCVFTTSAGWVTSAANVPAVMPQEKCTSGDWGSTRLPTIWEQNTNTNQDCTILEKELCSITSTLDLVFKELPLFPHLTSLNG